MKRAIVFILVLFVLTPALWAYFDPDDVGYGDFVLQKSKDVHVCKITEKDKAWKESLLKKLRVNKKFYTKGGVLKEYVLTDQICSFKIPVFVQKEKKDSFWALYNRNSGYSIDLDTQKAIWWDDIQSDVDIPHSGDFFILQSQTGSKEKAQKPILKINGGVGWQEFSFTSGDDSANHSVGNFRMDMTKLIIHPMTQADKDWLQQGQAKVAEDKDKIKEMMVQYQLPPDVKKKIKKSLALAEDSKPDEKYFYKTNYYCELSMPVYQEANDPGRFLVYAGSNIQIQILNYHQKTVGRPLDRYFHVSPNGGEVISIINGTEMRRSSGMARPGNQDDVYEHYDESCVEFQGLKVKWKDSGQ